MYARELTAGYLSRLIGLPGLFGPRDLFALVSEKCWEICFLGGWGNMILGAGFIFVLWEL